MGKKFVMKSGSRDPWQTLRHYQVILDTIKPWPIIIKEKLNEILSGKNVRVANRYLQFYRILAIFGSVKSGL